MHNDDKLGNTDFNGKLKVYRVTLNLISLVIKNKMIWKNDI